MKIKILNIENTHELESDYDTAVDMVHWSLNTTTYHLETLDGLKLSLQVLEESTTHSYLEPDFDLIEEDNKAGNEGEIVYIQHSDNSNDSFTKSYMALSHVTEKKIFLTEQEYSDYLHKYKDIDEEKKYRYDMIHGLKFSNFEEQEQGYLKEPEQTNFSAKSLEILIANIDAQFKVKNKYYEIEIPEEIKNEFYILNKEQVENTQYNSQKMIESMAIKANVRLSILLDKMASEAKETLNIASEYNPKIKFKF